MKKKKKIKYRVIVDNNTLLQGPYNTCKFSYKETQFHLINMCKIKLHKSDK